jgi:hypothetical protein
MTRTDVNRPSERSAIDDAIDRVAAEATAGEPSPEFRARVMARLGERRPAYAWPLVAVATAAVVIVAVVTNLPRQHEVPSLQTIASAPSPEHAIAAAAPDLSAVDPAVTVVRRPALAVRAATYAPPAGLPPIEPLEPITQESIQPTTLSIPQLTVKPIVMPAVDDDGSNRERR